MLEQSHTNHLQFAAQSLAKAAARLGLTGFRPKAPGALSVLGFPKVSDFGTISVGTLQTRLRMTLRSCAEVHEHFPVLEQSYRSRRRQLAASALTLAGSRLFFSCQKILTGEIPADANAFIKPVMPLLVAGRLGLYCRLLRQFLALMPEDLKPSTDDRILRAVLRLLGSVQNVVEKLDHVGSFIEARRKGWLRLEVFGANRLRDDALIFSQAMREVSWLSHTCVSKAILLSTLRDNNTGMYHHAALSKKFPSSIVNRTLARIHRETCEELLEHPFPELVYELELYADQSRANRDAFLRNWKGIRAYRTARPAELDTFSSQCFELTLDLAVAALDSHVMNRFQSSAARI